MVKRNKLAATGLKLAAGLLIASVVAGCCFAIYLAAMYIEGACFQGFSIVDCPDDVIGYVTGWSWLPGAVALLFILVLTVALAVVVGVRRK